MGERAEAAQLSRLSDIERRFLSGRARARHQLACAVSETATWKVVQKQLAELEFSSSSSSSSPSHNSNFSYLSSLGRAEERSQHFCSASTWTKST